MPAAAAAAMRVDSGETVRAIEWLKHITNFSGAGALDYLDGLISSNNILSIYRRMFGSVYRASTAPTCGRDGYYTGHTPREAEFLRLIAKHYFPLPEDIGWEDQGDHYDEIPITPLQGEAWCGCGYLQFEELNSCYYVAFCILHGGDYWEHAVERYNLDPSVRAPHGNVDFDLFKKLCQEEQTPLRHLPLALELMYYETGNEWLDSTFCQGTHSYPWDRFRNPETFARA